MDRFELRVILERLPHYLCLSVSRKLNDKLDIKDLLLEVRQELEAREAYNNINGYQDGKSNYSLGSSLSLPLNCFRGLLFVFFATGCIFQTGVEILRSSEKYLLCLVGEYLLRNSNQKKVSFVVMIQLSTQPYALLEIRTLQIFHIQVIVKPRTWEIYSKLTIESMVESMTENTSTTLHVNQNI